MTQDEAVRRGSRLIVMGRLTGPFGVKGWVRVQPFTDSPDGLGAYREWWLGGDGEWQSVRVEDWQRHGACLIARLSGCADRETAAALRGKEVAVPREALPPTADGEYYQADLIGLEVVNRAGERLGSIERVFGNGAHDILVVRGGDGERLIPFIGPVIDAVDLQAGEVRVDWGADW